MTLILLAVLWAVCLVVAIGLLVHFLSFECYDYQDRGDY